MKSTILAFVPLFLFFLGHSQTSFAQVGVTDTSVNFGVINATTGPNSSLGKDLNIGAKVVIDKVNREGGVAGRKINFIYGDDAYEPSQTAQTAAKLEHDSEIFGFFDSLGTPTTKALLYTLDKYDAPLLGAITGAQMFRTPVNKNVFMTFANYAEETEIIVAQIVDRLRIREIGILMQDDSYGDAGLQGISEALKKRGLNPVATGHYQRNTENITEALNKLKAAKVKAVVFVSTSKASAAFLRLAKTEKFTPKVFSLSFVGTYTFINAAGPAADDVYITQIVPDPRTSKLPIVARYRADMKAANENESNYLHLQGYINASILVEALKATGKQLTRDSFRATLDVLNLDLGGLAFTFTPQNHQASHHVYLTKVKNGVAVEIQNAD